MTSEMGEAENKNHTYNHNVHNTHVHNFISFSREFFPPFAGDWALNKGDPNAAQFSRMDEVDKFIGNDGKYNLKYVPVNEKQAFPFAFNYCLFSCTDCAIKSSTWKTTATFLTRYSKNHKI